MTECEDSGLNSNTTGDRRQDENDPIISDGPTRPIHQEDQHYVPSRSGRLIIIVIIIADAVIYSQRASVVSATIRYG